MSQDDIRYLIRALVKYKASDLHLKVGRPPLFRINGKLIPAKLPELTQHQADLVINSILTPKRISELEHRKQIDFSFQLADFGRFRCNVYFQKGTLSAAIRLIPSTVPTLNQLGLPGVLKDLCQKRRGLILVTGATGAGKSSTLAAMIQHINENNYVHILSLEDPIEFVFRDIKSSITQREVGSDIVSLKDGLTAGLRQDPDVIVIGEMRDLETIQVALTAAETGHLVISTLHTKDAKSTIERILDVFHSEAQNQIRIQLASTLLAVITQQLVPRIDGTGRVVACEIMVKSPTIEEMVLKNEVNRITNAIANSNNYYKMQTMNQALEKLVIQGVVSLEEALKSSQNSDDLKLRLSGVDRKEGY